MSQDPAMVAAVRACLQGEGVRPAARRFAVSHATLARRVRKAKRDLAQDAIAESETVEVRQGETVRQGATSTQEGGQLRQPVELVRTLHPDLTFEQQRGLQALLAGATQKEAADVVGVNKATVTKWMRPGHLFRQLLDEINHDRQRAYRASLLNQTPRALQVLGEAMEATKPVQVGGDQVEVDDHTVRLRAAAEVLDRGGVLPKLTQVEQQHTGEVGVALTLPQIEDKAAQLRARREKLKAKRRELGDE